jgi:hypothetical protein
MISLLILQSQAGDLGLELTDMTFGGLVVLGLGDLFLQFLDLLLYGCHRRPPYSE